MSAVSDYQQAVRVLAKPLPAYVSYKQSSHAKVDSIEKAESSTVTVRTRDGKIVKGHGLTIVLGEDKQTKDSVLKNSPFVPKCYTATAERAEQFEGRAVEALTLRNLCVKREGDEDGDFTTFFVDAHTLDPVAAVGGKSKAPVQVYVVERWLRAGDYVLPGAIAARVKGSGFMFWLDVDAHVEFSQYRFSGTLP